MIMNWTELLKCEMERSYATTERLLGLVDGENLGWKPASGTNWMTMGQLLKHIGSACGAGCKGFVTGDWGLPKGKRLEDLPPEEMMPPAEMMPTVSRVEEAKQLLSRDRTLALKMVKRAGERRLGNQKMEAPWAPGPKYALGRHLLQMVQHLERHKSQLFYYLKLQGKAVGTAELWG